MKYLHLAETLATASGEAEQRSAISRAYYAAYHRALEQAAYLGLNTAPDECESHHQACWRAYLRERNRARRKVGESGSRLRGLRNDADYEPAFRVDAAKAAQAVDDARSLINKIALT